MFAIYDSSVVDFFKNENIRKRISASNDFTVTGNSLIEIQSSKGYINLLNAMEDLIQDSEIVGFFCENYSLKTLDMFIWKR